MTALIIGLIIGTLMTPAKSLPVDDCYSVWSEGDRIHLIMCDNGTPDDFDDDWVVDWETNRDFHVEVYDW